MRQIIILGIFLSIKFIPCLLIMEKEEQFKNQSELFARKDISPTKNGIPISNDENRHFAQQKSMTAINSDKKWSERGSSIQKRKTIKLGSTPLVVVIQQTKKLLTLQKDQIVLSLLPSGEKEEEKIRKVIDVYLLSNLSDEMVKFDEIIEKITDELSSKIVEFVEKIQENTSSLDDLMETYQLKMNDKKEHSNESFRQAEVELAEIGLIKGNEKSNGNGCAALRIVEKTKIGLFFVLLFTEFRFNLDKRNLRLLQEFVSKYRPVEQKTLDIGKNMKAQNMQLERISQLLNKIIEKIMDKSNSELSKANDGNGENLKQCNEAMKKISEMKDKVPYKNGALLSDWIKNSKVGLEINLKRIENEQNAKTTIGLMNPIYTPPFAPHANYQQYGGIVPFGPPLSAPFPGPSIPQYPTAYQNVDLSNGNLANFNAPISAYDAYAPAYGTGFHIPLTGGTNVLPTANAFDVDYPYPHYHNYHQLAEQQQQSPMYQHYMPPAQQPSMAQTLTAADYPSSAHAVPNYTNASTNNFVAMSYPQTNDTTAGTGYYQAHIPNAKLQNGGAIGFDQMGQQQQHQQQPMMAKVQHSPNGQQQPMVAHKYAASKNYSPEIDDPATVELAKKLPDIDWSNLHSETQNAEIKPQHKNADVKKLTSVFPSFDGIDWTFDRDTKENDWPLRAEKKQNIPLAESREMLTDKSDELNFMEKQLRNLSESVAKKIVKSTEKTNLPIREMGQETENFYKDENEWNRIMSLNATKKLSNNKLDDSLHQQPFGGAKRVGQPIQQPKKPKAVIVGKKDEKHNANGQQMGTMGTLSQSAAGTIGSVELGQKFITNEKSVKQPSSKLANIDEQNKNNPHWPSLKEAAVVKNVETPKAVPSPESYSQVIQKKNAGTKMIQLGRKPQQMKDNRYAADNQRANNIHTH